MSLPDLVRLQSSVDFRKTMWRNLPMFSLKQFNCNIDNFQEEWNVYNKKKSEKPPCRSDRQSNNTRQCCALIEKYSRSIEG